MEPPRCRGHYVLVLEAPRRIRFETGRHGMAELGPGVLLYVGSAHGPGGLGARLSRHLCGRRRRLHWHIDRLIAAGAVPILAVARCHGERLEESVASRCAERCRLALPGFGSSDKPGSPGHLYYCGSLLEAVRAALWCVLAEPPSNAPGERLGDREGPGEP